jgi:hypothetical protein
MRKRFNILAVAVVLAIISFAYARYDYSNKNSATLTNPFNSGEKAKLTNPFMNQDLFGDWMTHKDAVVFAIIVPVALIAGGVALAVRK